MKKGFSLIEVLIAMTILSIGLLALANMQTVAMKTSASSLKRTIGKEQAQTQLEMILNSTYANLPNLNGTYLATVNGVNYTTVVVVGQVNTIGNLNNTITITITTTWKDGKYTRSFQLTTLRSSTEDGNTTAF